MRTRGLRLAISMIAALVGEGAIQGSPMGGEPCIALFWSDYRLLAEKLAPGARKSLEIEARTIFEEAGIDVTFHRGSPEGGSPSEIPGTVVRVVLMPRTGEGWALPVGAMGAILDHAPGERTVYVFVPAVELTLGYSLERAEMLHDGRKARRLAQAMARVIAHEVVHAIDPRIPHGPEGSVMSDRLTSDLLSRPRLSFHETTSKRLLESLEKEIALPAR